MSVLRVAVEEFVNLARRSRDARSDLLDSLPDSILGKFKPLERGVLATNVNDLELGVPRQRE